MFCIVRGNKISRGFWALRNSSDGKICRQTRETEEHPRWSVDSHFILLRFTVIQWYGLDFCLRRTGYFLFPFINLLDLRRMKGLPRSRTAVTLEFSRNNGTSSQYSRSSLLQCYCISSLRTFCRLLIYQHPVLQISS